MSSVKLNVLEVVDPDDTDGFGLSGSLPPVFGVDAIILRLTKNTIIIATPPTTPPHTTPMMIFAGLKCMSTQGQTSEVIEDKTHPDNICVPLVF